MRSLGNKYSLLRCVSGVGLVDALTAHYGSPGRLADYRRQFERTTRTVGEDPAIFATALETLAVKAFGDMGQTARLRLIRDRFIAGHSNCDLRRHLDSVSPETPIRDVVDRCHVWVIHADPAVRRISKPNPDPTYPAYAVGDADSDNEVTRVAVVTGQRLGQNQLEDLLRRVISTTEPPAPKPEVPDAEKLLQQLVRGTQSRSPAVVSPPVPTQCRLADYRRQFERTTRTVGEDPAIFATALETLAVKAFGDMGQTARLRLIRDRFIAGHSNCDSLGKIRPYSLQL